MKMQLLLPLMALCVASAHGGHYPQYFQAFNLTSCLGPSADFLESIQNMTEHPVFKATNSISSRGLWRSRFSNGEELTVGVSHESPQKFCFTYPRDTGEDFRLDAATNLVPGDLDDSALVLYTGDIFNGDSKVVNTSESLFDEPFQLTSWAFTGPAGFTLYSGANFTGNSTCLEAGSETKVLGWGLTLGFDVCKTSVHSVKIGCDNAATRKIQGDSDTLTRVFNTIRETEVSDAHIEIVPKNV